MRLVSVYKLVSRQNYFQSVSAIQSPPMQYNITGYHVHVTVVVKEIRFGTCPTAQYIWIDNGYDVKIIIDGWC